MSNIIPFVFDECPVRTVVVEETPWWVGKDVCGALGYKDTVNALKKHCKGVVKHHPIVDSMGRKQEVRIIGEGDVFRLIVASHLPQAQRFERYLFDVMLPQIRRTGSFSTSAVEDLQKSLMIAMSERNTYKRLWEEDRRTVKRHERRNIMPIEDKREILTLYNKGYSISAIQQITKKGRIRIKNFLNEVLSMGDSAMDAMFAEWDKAESLGRIAG